MKIVIELTDEMYANVQAEVERSIHPSRDARWARLLLAICNGEVLPKGYGRLIDADDLKKKAVMCPTVGNAEVPLLDIMDVDCSPTIIGADKEVDE